MTDPTNSNITRSARNGANAESGRRGPSPALIALVILATAVVIFFLRNSDNTEIDFMLFDWDTTVRWSIFVSILLGVLLDRLFTFWWRRRRRGKNDSSS